MLGQFPLDETQARAAIEALGLPDDAIAELTTPPMRGALEGAVPTDPTIYRLYEIVQVYGPAIKELIHEEFGDGIMSAINFGFTVRRVPDPAGDRVDHDERQVPAVRVAGVGGERRLTTGPR